MATLLSLSSCTVGKNTFQSSYRIYQDFQQWCSSSLDTWWRILRASTKVVGRSRYLTLFFPEPLFVLVYYKMHIYSVCCPHFRFLCSSLYPKTFWPCCVSLISQAVLWISVQCKCIWWANLRHFSLVLDHYRHLLHFLWFLAATTGFLNLASALFLLLKLSNWLHRQSKNLYALDKSFKLFVNLSLKISLPVTLWKRMKNNTLLITKASLKY